MRKVNSYVLKKLDKSYKSKKLKPKEDSSVCPICGYYIGTSSVCPRCGAQVQKRIAIKLVRNIAIWGSILGVFLLWVAVKSKKAPVVKIENMTETMNYAYVKVIGKVDNLVIDESKNSFKVIVNDGTGKLSVNCFNKYKQFKKILDDNFPGFGDRIEVTGALNFSQAWGPSMFLTVPERIKVLKKYEFKTIRLNKISIYNKGDIFKIKVAVLAYKKYKTRKGFLLHKFFLHDGSVTREMVLFESEYMALTEVNKKLLTTPGNQLEILIRVDTYRGTPQIKLFKTAGIESIKFLGKANLSKPFQHLYQQKKIQAKEIALGNLTEDMVGEIVKIKGTVHSIRTNKGGTVLTLSDDTGQIDLFIYKGYKDELPEIKIGSVITGICKVNIFRDTLQVKLYTTNGFKVE